MARAKATAKESGADLGFEAKLWLAALKLRKRTAQVRTAMAGNPSMLRLYWEMGGMLEERHEFGFDLRLVPEKLAEPIRWSKPKKIFVNSNV